MLHEPAAAHSGPGTVLALRAGVCELTEVSLRNWYFCEFFIPILSYTMSKNNSIISLGFPILICRWKEHAVKQIPGQRHNLRNVKGPVCTVPHCLDGCGLSCLLLKVNAHLLLLRGTSSSPGFHPYGRAILLPSDRWEMWIP